jgi:hypothetical protein
VWREEGTCVPEWNLDFLGDEVGRRDAKGKGLGGGRVFLGKEMLNNFRYPHEPHIGSLDLKQEIHIQIQIHTTWPDETKPAESLWSAVSII